MKQLLSSLTKKFPFNAILKCMRIGAIALSVTSLSAYAQDESAVDAEQNGSADEEVVEKIMVTARKREESIADVPVAVSALTEDVINNLVLDSAEDYIRQFPSVSLLSSGTEILTGISIRGQGGGRNGFAETATGLFRNGIYMAGGGFGGRSLTRMDFFDAGQVEVFRGPQGSLYGRNAVGGAVNVNSRRPNVDKVTGFVRGNYWSDVDRTDISAAVNLPVNESLAFRVGGYSYQQDEGFHVNIRPEFDGEYLDTKSYEGFRVQSIWYPSDNTSVLFGIERSDDRAPAFANIGFNAAHDPDFYSHNISSPSWAETEELFAFAIIDGEWNTNTWRLAVSRNQRDGERVNEDLDHFIGFQDRVFAGTEVVLFATQMEEYESYTADFFIASDPDKQLSWLIGAEYVGYEDDYDTLNFGQSPPIPGFLATLRDDLALENLDSFAVYGAIEYKASEKLDFGLEMRVQRDSKDFEFDRIRNARPTQSIAAEFSVDTDRSWTAFTPTFSMDYSVSEDQSIYARLATAYRPGGFNAQIPPELGEDVVIYDNEYTYGAEIGWKRFFENYTFTLAIFTQKTDDLQVATSASETVRSFILQNVPDASFTGAELEAVGRFDVGPGQLKLNVGLSTVDGEYGDGSTVVFDGSILDISDNRVSKTRDLNTQISALYELPVSSKFNAFFSVSYQSEKGGYDSAANPPDRAFPGFEFFDARAGIRSENLDVSIWGRNIKDERYNFANVSGNLYFSDGEVWGVAATYRF